MEQSEPQAGIHLFVYGTLMTGNGTPAVIPGKMYNVHEAFPGVKLLDNLEEGRVYGEIIFVPQHRILATDRYEGYNENNPTSSYYIRVPITATILEDGSEFECNVYEFNADISGLQPVESGKWGERSKYARS